MCETKDDKRPISDAFAEINYQEPMSVRDWFAAAAVIGDLASRPPEKTVLSADSPKFYFDLADAMMQERRERSP